MLGGVTSVVLADADLIKEAFSSPSTTGRRTIPALEDFFYLDCGLLASTGELWQQSRRFTLHHLRNLGMGRTRLEAVILDQVTEFLDEVLAPSLGQSLDIQDTLKISIANIIWGTVSSERYSIRDERARSLLAVSDDTGKQELLILALILFPWIKRLPHHWTGLDRLRGNFERPLDILMRPALAEHARTVNMSGEPRDYIDALLQEQARDPGAFTERHLLRSIFDLFLAGSDTTTSTLRWAFCLLAAHPEQQQRLREELQHQLAGRTPTLADRHKLPFTEATLMEVQRVANVAPYGVEHVANETLELRGYTVPKGTLLVSLLAAVHMDPTNFENPQQFQPDRFLDAQGKLEPSKFLMPFSVGKRACLGEALARAEVFLFVTCVLQKYRLRFPDGFQHDFGVIPYKMVIRDLTPFKLVVEDVAVPM